MKKLYLISIFIFIFFVNPVFAEDYLMIDQSQHDGTTWNRAVYQSFYTTTNTISGVGIWEFDEVGGINEYDYILCKCIDENNCFDYNAMNVVGSFPYFETQCVTGITEEIKKWSSINPLEFADPFQVTENQIIFSEILNVGVNKKVYLSARQHNSSSASQSFNWGWRYSSLDPYTNGNMTDTGSADLAFRIYSNDNPQNVIIVTLDGYGMSIVNPYSITYPNFTLKVDGDYNYPFRIAYSIPDTKDLYQIKWTRTDEDNNNPISQIQNLSDLDNENNFTFDLNIPLHNDDKYNIYFELSEISTNEVKSSFYIYLNQDKPLLEIGEEDKGFWGNLFYWLFVPSNSSIESFLNVKDDLMKKAPFGYWTLAKEQMEEISITSTTTPTLNLDVNIGGTETILSVLDMQATENLVGSTTMTLLYNFIKYSMLLGLISYLFIRITRLFVA